MGLLHCFTNEAAPNYLILRRSFNRVAVEVVPEDLILFKTLGVLVELLSGDLFACDIIFRVRSGYTIFAMRHDRVALAREADGCVAIISRRSIDTPHKRAVSLDIFHIITFMERKSV